MSSSDLNTREPISKREWKDRMAESCLEQRDLDRLVLDYLVTSGYATAAAHFSESASLSSPTSRTFAAEAREKVSEALLEGHIDTAIALIDGIDPELLDVQTDLHFELQRQKLVELIRSANLDAAMAFAHDELAPRAEDSPFLLGELEKVMILFAFPDPSNSPAADLMDLSRRRRVAAAVNSAILHSLSAPAHSKLSDALHLYHWTRDEVGRRVDVAVVDAHITDSLHHPQAHRDPSPAPARLNA